MYALYISVCAPIKIHGLQITKATDFSDFNILTHSKYTSNMAGWFYAQFTAVTAPHVCSATQSKRPMYHSTSDFILLNKSG